MLESTCQPLPRLPKTSAAAKSAWRPTKMDTFLQRLLDNLFAIARKQASLQAMGIAVVAALFIAVLPAMALTQPSITPATGSFATSQTVTLTGPGGGATVYYTTDGSAPTNASTAYSTPFTVSNPTQVNAVAYLSGTYSLTTTVYLDVDPRLAPVLEPAGLALRLNADLGIVAEVGSPAAVDQWTDLSGSGNNASGVLGSKPLFIETAVNGLSAVSFDGFSQYLSLLSGFANFNTVTYVTCGGAPAQATGGNALKITINGTDCSHLISTSDTNATTASALATAINAALIPGVSATSSGAVIQITAPIAATYATTVFQGLTLTVQPAGATLFIVTAPSSLPASARIFDLGDAASGNNILCQIASSGSLGQFSAFNGTSGTNAQSANALTANQYQVLTAVQAPGASTGAATFFVNGTPGTQNASMNNFPNVSRTSNFIGQASSGGNFYPGQICEVLLYASSLSDSQIASITGMFAAKYQLINQTPAAPIISLPAGTLNGPTQVTISGEPGAVVRYTTDGITTPSASSPAFNGVPLTINYSQTIKAAAFKNGLQSSTTTNAYILDASQWPAPSSMDVTAPSINLQLPTPSI